jgi:hypothetical protein
VEVRIAHLAGGIFKLMHCFPEGLASAGVVVCDLGK